MHCTFPFLHALFFLTSHSPSAPHWTDQIPYFAFLFCLQDYIFPTLYKKKKHPSQKRRMKIPNFENGSRYLLSHQTFSQSSQFFTFSVILFFIISNLAFMLTACRPSPLYYSSSQPFIVLLPPHIPKPSNSCAFFDCPHPYLHPSTTTVNKLQTLTPALIYHFLPNSL